MMNVSGKSWIGLGALAVLTLYSGLHLAARVEAPPAQRQIAYGQGSRQVGELSLPSGPGAHPVVILVHGGAWRSASSLAYMRPAAAELTRRGYAVWSIEYRALGDPGGGFPGTFLDVGAAADHLGDMAKTMPLDLSCVVAVGHSAGGHLAMWLAARGRLPPSSPLYKTVFVPVNGVVDLAGPPNLRKGDPGNRWGGAAEMGALIGAPARGYEAALRDTSPAEMLPLGVRQVLLFGGKDGVVPADHGSLYRQDAAAKGESVDLRIVPEAGHQDFVAPGSVAWEEGLSAIGSVCAP